MTAAKKAKKIPESPRGKNPKGRKAFTFVELLITIIVVTILGSAVVSALWIMFNMVSQTSDYIGGREEIEFVAQSIGREVSNVGLAMPNNRKEEGSFASSFQMGDDSPIMAIMGKPGEAWGGPITLGQHNSRDQYMESSMVRTLTTEGGKSFYHGPELYYAWSVPTGVKIRYADAADGGVIRDNGDALSLEFAEATGLSELQNFSYTGRNIGITAGNPKSSSSWILFPTSRVPMLIDRIEPTVGGRSLLDVRIAPGSPLSISGPFTGLDEACLPQVARLYLNDNGELVQLIFGSDYENAATARQNVLAHNIVGLHFTYDPRLRVLSMYIAAQGEEGNVHEISHDPWPSFADALPVGRRLVINRIDWRIRN
jgi:hypothetical protein